VILSGDGQEQATLADSSSPARQLVEVLVASITALADAGEVDTACRLAGRACVALRTTDPAAAHRFDALLHRLTRALAW
jgi:hypothetical protein